MSKPYVYTIERWDDAHKEWIPYRFDISDLEDMEKTINLLEEILPNTEFRPAQYMVSEYKHISVYE